MSDEIQPDELDLAAEEDNGEDDEKEGKAPAADRREDKAIDPEETSRK